MKNLKKVLSLVLALAMALSLMTVAFAKDASDYNDYDEVTYKEAVDVMTAAGIFDGMGANNFQPDGTLTREQAAKIITYMLMGKSNADKLTTTIAPYGDVSADRWSAGAIAYCTNEGIISGMGHNKFAPSDPVTGLQFAKMLLVALGYDAEIENLVGDSWAINTSKLAISVGLDDNMEEVSLSQPLTREQATLMAFNAMQSPLVEYPSKGTTIEVNGATVSFGAQQAQYVTSTRANEQTISSERLSNTKDYTIEFAERYCRDLTLRADRDAFERPAHTWRYDNDLVGTYVNASDLTYTAPVELTEVYADLGLTKSAKATEQYIDGKPAAAADLQTLVRRDSTDEKIDGSGNGVLTQVWYEEDDEGNVVSLIITAVNTYVAEVGSVSNANSDERAVTLATKTAPANLTRQYETQDFAAGDLVAYTAAWNGSAYEIQTVKDLEMTSTGVLTQWNGLDTGNSESNFTAGEKYEYSAKAYIDVDGNQGTIDDFEVDESELNVYVDDYGYALYVEGVEAAKNYAVVIGVGSSNTHGSQTFGATLLLPDGTQKEVTAVYDESATGVNGATVKLTGNDGENNSYNGGNAQLVSDMVGDLVLYRVNKDGEYELTMAGLDSTKATATGAYNNDVTDSGDIKFVNGRSLLTVDTNSDGTVDKTMYATDKTLFFVATNGTGKVVYNVYEGYKNMPSLKDTNVGIAYVTNSEYTSQVDAVYITADSLKGMSANATFVVKQFDHNVVTDNTGSYFVMPAIVNNEVTTVKVNAEKYGANGAALDNIGATAADQKTGVFNMTNVLTDEDGIITDATFNAPTTNANFVNGQSYYTTTGLVAANNGVIGLGSDNKTSAIYWAYTDETNFYEVSEDMKTINKVSATSLSTDANDVVYFVADDDATASWKVVQTVIVLKVKDDTVNNPTSNYEIWAAGSKVTNLTGVQIEDGVVSFTDSLKVVNTVPVADVAAATNVKVSYAISSFNSSTGEWNPPETVTSATTANLARDTDINTVCNANYAAADGANYRVTVTVTCDQLTYTYPTVVVKAVIN